MFSLASLLFAKYIVDLHKQRQEGRMAARPLGLAHQRSLLKYPKGRTEVK
jgi:hypothetical protein